MSTVGDNLDRLYASVAEMGGSRAKRRRTRRAEDEERNSPTQRGMRAG